MDKELEDLLKAKKTTILNKWFDAIIETYPKDTSGFLKKQKDRFSNPVGHAISQGIEEMFAALLEERDFAEGFPYLEDILRVRAVQDFTPAKAVSFIFDLKHVVRAELAKDIRQKQIFEAVSGFETKIDDLALLAFNIYTQCREHLNQIKIDELKRMTYTLMKNANILYDMPAQESEQYDIPAQFEHHDLKFNI